MEDIKEILACRQATHGNFWAHSEVSQNLKSCLIHHSGWLKLEQLQREALEMICHKIARTMAGDPKHIDHWLDISGYATLVVDSLAKKGEK